MLLDCSKINWWKGKVENNTCSHNLALRLQECLVQQKRPVWFHHRHACHMLQIYTIVRSIFWVSSNFTDVFRKRPSMTTYYSEEVPSHQQQMHSYMQLSWNPSWVSILYSNSQNILHLINFYWCLQQESIYSNNKSKEKPPHQQQMHW